jgi:hypothetical protein
MAVNEGRVEVNHGNAGHFEPKKETKRREGGKEIHVVHLLIVLDLIQYRFLLQMVP